MLWAFQDRWYYLKGMWARVKRSGSDQVLLHTTKHETSTLQWNDLDGGHLLLIDLQPLKRGPPVRRGPLPWVTPMQHLYIQELWIEAFCPTIETHSLAPMVLEVKERSLLLSELSLLRPKRNGTRMLREPIYLLWNDIGVSTGDDKCDVDVHYRELKYPEMTTCNYAQNKDRRWIWCDTEPWWFPLPQSLKHCPFICFPNETCHHFKEIDYGCQARMKSWDIFLVMPKSFQAPQFGG